MSDNVVANERRQSLNVLATSMTQESHAFAGAIFGPANSDMIGHAQTHAMNDKAAAADFARDLFEHVMLGIFFRDRENADAKRIGRARQSNHARRAIGHDR
jgi:hypothetical protein